jgi:hypothetical protein
LGRRGEAEWKDIKVEEWHRKMYECVRHGGKYGRMAGHRDKMR